MPTARSILGWAAALFLLVPIGCNGLSVREPWIRNAIHDRTERRQATNQLSSATGAVLLRYDLLKTAARDPGAAASILGTKLESGPPLHDGALCAG